MSPIPPTSRITLALPLPIETARMIMRVPTVDDVDAMQAAKVERWPDLQRWMNWASDSQLDRIGLEERTLKAQERIEAGTELSLIGVDKHTGDFILSTGINLLDAPAGRYETGYWIAKAYEGDGYTTEATSAIIAYAFHAMGVKRLEINHYVGNGGSQRVIQKCGFAFESVRKAHSYRSSDGAIMDALYYVRFDAQNLPHPMPRWG